MGGAKGKHLFSWYFWVDGFEGNAFSRLPGSFTQSICLSGYLTSWLAMGIMCMWRLKELEPVRGHWMSPNQKLIHVLVVSSTIATFGGSL